MPECNASGPRQLLPGTRFRRYRCSLPGLAEFTVNRRGEADADRARLSPLNPSDTTTIRLAPEVMIFFEYL